MAGKRFERTTRFGNGSTADASGSSIALGEREDELRPTIAVDREIGLAQEGALPTSSRRDRIYRRSLALADLCAAALALALGVVVLGGDRATPALIAGLPLVVIVGKVIGLYDRDERLLNKATLEEAPALFQVATLFTLVIWLAEGALVEESVLGAPNELGRSQVLGIWGLLFFSMLGGRAAARWTVRHLVAEERCLLLGSVTAARRIERSLSAAHHLDAKLVGRVPLEADELPGRGIPILGGIGSLPSLIEEHGIERVIIAPASSDTDELLGAISLVKSLHVKVSVLPRLFEVVGSSVRFDDVAGLMLLGVPPFGLSRSSRFLKRSVDVFVSLTALTLLAPLLAVIAASIKLTSKGPVIFRQRRIGENGVEFEMFKFRTMVEEAEELKSELEALNEAEGLFKIEDDPRLTRVGRILRRLSLDEIPQLANVLSGKMSLVGPRPLVPDDDSRVQGWHRRRLSLPPGMTGEWQVLGSARIPLAEMVKIDYLYGANWSLWLDLRILLRTVPYVVGRRGL